LKPAERTAFSLYEPPVEVNAVTQAEICRKRADELLRQAEVVATPSAREVVCDIAEAYRTLAGNDGRDPLNAPREVNPLACLPLLAYRFPNFKLVGNPADAW
jgi:hypothetical protein